MKDADSAAMDPQQSVHVGVTRLGRAVFSISDFSAGDEIAAIIGRRIPDTDYGSDYCIDLSEGGGLEPAPPYRFLNHSCDPNCEIVIWEDGNCGDTQVCLHALSPIRRGDELTIDYAWPAEESIRCHCGSSNCRGWIVSADEVALLE